MDKEKFGVSWDINESLGRESIVVCPTQGKQLHCLRTISETKHLALAGTELWSQKLPANSMHPGKL
jgi:hypothetical protein